MSETNYRPFVGDGYTDLDRLAEDLLKERNYGCETRMQLRSMIAGVLQDVLLRISDRRTDLRLRETELWDAVTGIVTCAQAEGLIAEEWS